MKWMDPFLQSGQLSGKIICPNEKCRAKVGNYDWAGVCCGCKEWVTPVSAVIIASIILHITDQHINYRGFVSIDPRWTRFWSNERRSIHLPRSVHKRQHSSHAVSRVCGGCSDSFLILDKTFSSRAPNSQRLQPFPHCSNYHRLLSVNTKACRPLGPPSPPKSILGLCSSTISMSMCWRLSLLQHMILNHHCLFYSMVSLNLHTLGGKSSSLSHKLVITSLLPIRGDMAKLRDELRPKRVTLTIKSLSMTIFHLSACWTS